MLLLKFLTNRFKSIGSKIKKDQEVSFTKSTIFLAFTELLMVVLGILLALYIDRWNTSKNFEKQFESTLRIVQQNIENDIYKSDNVIAHYNARDSLRHNIMLNKFDRKYYEKGISYWQKAIVFYNQFEISTDGYNLLLEMNEEIPDKYYEINKKIKKLYKRIPTINEYNKNFKEIIWGIHNELTYSYWFWVDDYYGEMSNEQIDFYISDPYYKALVQKVLNASGLLNGVAIAHRVEAIDIYNDINEILGPLKEVPKNITYVLADSSTTKYVGTYKMIEGDSTRRFPKYYSDSLILEIGIKDSILYLMRDNDYIKKLYYFDRQYQNRTYPIKKHHVFISNLGFFEFYKNGNLKVGAAGPHSIWEKQ